MSEPELCRQICARPHGADASPAQYQLLRSALQQESDMARRREINMLSDQINLVSDDALDAVSGGRIRWIDIHMPYKDFIKWPGGDPSPTRVA